VIFSRLRDWLPFERILILIIAIAATDQWIKVRIVDTLALGESRPLLSRVVDITYRQNTGVAFSAFPHASVYVLIALNLLIMGLFVTLMWPRLHKISAQLAIGLVCGGAIGNLIDRIRLHYVIDYLDFHFWPVFNLADASIVIGVGVLLLVHLFAYRSSALSPGGNRS
jgi:signal peptidase II